MLKAVGSETGAHPSSAQPTSARIRRESFADGVRIFIERGLPLAPREGAAAGTDRSSFEPVGRNRNPARSINDHAFC
jgi:hypothetical protein